MYDRSLLPESKQSFFLFGPRGTGKSSWVRRQFPDASYIDLLESERARRRVVAHPKLFFFDAGVYRTVRPRGPLDRPEEIDGAALETLLFQHARALNDYLRLGHTLYYWRSATGLEVDLVGYGERGIRAFEAKRAARLRPDDFRGLRAFLDDYPMARAYMFYGGERRFREGAIDVIPFADGLKELPALL